MKLLHKLQCVVQTIVLEIMNCMCQNAVLCPQICNSKFGCSQWWR